MFGHSEIIIIVGVIILLFGASAIPKLARSIGKARAEFEKGAKSVADDQEAANEDVQRKKGDDNA